MTSLTTHLRQSETHGRLAFHPDCPICRQDRLTGSLSAERFVPLRAQAALTAGMLAVSAAAPMASVAAEQDSEHSGTALPTQVGAPEPAANPEFDPGGDSASLPETAAPVGSPPTNSNDAVEPVDPEPATNPADPIVDAGDGTDGTAEPAAPPAVTSPPASSPAAEPPPATTPPGPEAPAASAPTPLPAPAVEAPAPERVDPPARSAEQPDDERDRDPAKAPPREATGPHQPRIAAAPAPPAGSQVAPAALPVNSRPAEAGDRAHTVRPGESLWAIAADVLGDEATPAQIAREVHRLWALNSERIGTGDPDLLMIGTRIKLR